MRKKIVVRAPALSRSGYGEHARYFLRALRKHEDKYDVYLLNTNWGKTSWIHHDNEERRWLDMIMQKTIFHQQKNGTYDISAQVTIPNEWEKMAPINIGITAGIETPRVAPQWIDKSFLMDKIIVVSEHSKQVYEDTAYHVKNDKTGEEITDFKCRTPIEVVGYPVREYDSAPVELELENDFNFLTVAQWGPRKNLTKTIKWFVEEFIDLDVGLILKTNARNGCTMDKIQTRNGIEKLLKDYPERKCKIYFLHGYMNNDEVHSLYSHSKINGLVSLTHGEGYGLPRFEAAYSGMPVITHDWGGQTDFLYGLKKDKKTGKDKKRAFFAKVDYDLKQIQPEAVWDGVLQADSQWAFPKEGKTKIKLRDFYKNYGRYKSQAKKLQKQILKEFDEEKIYKNMVDAIYEEEVFELEEWLQELEESVEEVE